ncbi:hypothetical protein [Amycolatopsis alba]|uniref:hypothetical protein n=1 Tax=Amycolatopsis alba TaxID=76020 RepID=UPI000A05578A|nr:hypothetical protein [Amycolatopsis alba]
MTRPWEADPAAAFARRLGKSAKELDKSDIRNNCPDIWELDNGDVAVIGRNLTSAYSARLPNGVSLGSDEDLVVIPRATLIAAKADIPDA